MLTKKTSGPNVKRTTPILARAGFINNYISKELNIEDGDSSLGLKAEVSSPLM